MIIQNISCETVEEHLLLMDVSPTKVGFYFKICNLHQQSNYVKHINPFAQHMKNYGRRLHDGWNFWKETCISHSHRRWQA
jgi:hypothetical protein